MCAVYMLYAAAMERTAQSLTASGEKALVIGMAALTEGEVIRADDEYTIIQYYHEWDGTDYKNVRPYAVPDYQAGMKVPVVYTIGMGAGTCLTVGFYKRIMLNLFIAGVILILLGMVINFKKKGNQENGKKKDYSRQLEDEHDAQRGSKAVR